MLSSTPELPVSVGVTCMQPLFILDSTKLIIWLIHSQKQLAHWAVDVTVEFYACLFSSSLMCNL